MFQISEYTFIENIYEHYFLPIWKLKKKYLKMIFLLTYKSIICVGKVEALVSIHSIMWCRAKIISQIKLRVNVLNSLAYRWTLLFFTYSSLRLWSQSECQEVCWKGWNRIHWKLLESRYIPPSVPPSWYETSSSITSSGKEAISLNISSLIIRIVI